MFSRILIANRGEIACRVIRTARRLGIATVAVYSAADRDALHVEMADSAVAIGPAPARDSYLNIAALVAAIRSSGAEAVHPGYGFLSENAEFAEACAAAGAVFIGPPPAAIRAMGSKAAAKALMAQHGVPLVPGYHGDDQDPALLAAEAARIGFPVMIKASAGGGGRGMRVVETASGFAAALAGARREATGAFGDDRILLETYLRQPRHIEFQIFADTHGNFVHLFERDCSIQRRHQKVIEEAPAPGMTAERRQAMGDAAVAAARAVGYVGAGTVEFITEGGRFYFMEMNTRLQVEHPVTEAVIGQDLVEWQLRVAAGETLPLRQDELVLHGHAIEARLYAENPDRGFLPATGTLHRLRFPPADLARVDTGVREGDVVTPFYDAMLAKIVAWGDDRAAARARLGAALAEMAILGIVTNSRFLGRIVAHPEFAAAHVDTGFIERHRADLLPPPAPPSDAALAAAAVHRLLAQDKAPGGAADPHSPWRRVDGWRLHGRAEQVLVFTGADGGRHVVCALAQAGGWRLDFGDHTGDVAVASVSDHRLTLDLGGYHFPAIVLDHAGDIVVQIAGDSWRLTEHDPLMPPADTAAATGRLTAPMPGRVIQLLVAAGDAVVRGQPLIIIEAMKMEHTVAAPIDGVVASVRFAVGDPVEENAELVVLTAAVPG